jgi:hypothetical protein
MSSETQILYADPEHNGIQTAVPLIFVGGLVVTYFLSLWLLPLLFGGVWANYLILGGCTAIPVAAGVMLLADNWFKRTWRSGQTVEVTPTTVSLHQANEQASPVTIDLTAPVDILRWSYQLGNWTKSGRERQIRNGWFCHALALKQGEQTLSLFTFVPSREHETLQQVAVFKQLDVAQLYDTSLTGRFQAYRSATGRPEIPGSLLIGDDRAYWRGERDRWRHGRELAPADFQLLLNHLKSVNPSSPPKD